MKDAADTGANSKYIAWEELQMIVDFGSSVCFHNVDQRVWGRSDPDSIALGFRDDYERTFDKLGVKMQVLALPDGNRAYAQAAQQSPLIAFFRSSLKAGNLIRLRSLLKRETYGGSSSVDPADKLAELARESASDDPYWVGLAVHRPQEDYVKMLETVYELYGKAGADNLWVASWDEIFEYVTLREGLQIGKRNEGRDVIFTVTLPTTDGFQFQEISLLLTGAGHTATWRLKARTSRDSIPGSTADGSCSMSATAAASKRWLKNIRSATSGRSMRRFVPMPPVLRACSCLRWHVPTRSASMRLLQCPSRDRIR